MASNGRSVSLARQNATVPELTIYCVGRRKPHEDGACVWEFLVKDREGKVRDRGCGVCKDSADGTHIDAEYRAVIEGLGWAAANATGRPVEVCTSLELIAEQVRGNWRVKAVKILPLRDEIRTLLGKANAVLRWIPIRQNQLARQLSRVTSCAEGEGVASL